MGDGYLEKRHIQLLLILFVFGFLVFLNPYNFFDFFREIFLKMTYPVRKTAFFVASKTSDTASVIFSIGEIKKENDILVEENQRLIFENAKIKDALIENDLLRKELDLLPRNKFDLESAFVVGFDLEGDGGWLLIDKGSRDGIGSGMPVVVSDGILVGKVDDVYDDSAKIILITNPNISINAVVNSSEIKGIIRGEYGLGMILDMVLQSDKLAIDDLVVTAGSGQLIPKGMIIGKIKEVKSSPDKLFQQASLIPFFDPEKLRVVSVIKK